MRVAWHIVTGEYPFQPGGVSDYSFLVARSLAGEGQEVHVWAPAFAGESNEAPGVCVHRLPGRFDLRSLRTLGATLNAWPGPSRILVQFVPHAFGWKAMNIGLARWLGNRRQPVWVMFHEVAFPGEPWRPLKHRFLARVTRAIARQVATAAERVFVSIPAWATLLRELCGKPIAAEWLPVVSNLPTAVDSGAATRFRDELGVSRETPVVGHFGTYGSSIAPMLEPAVRGVLEGHPSAVALFLGRGSERFAERFGDLRHRVRATGSLPDSRASEAITACDLMLQPYPDGVSSRRGSAMAAIALGRPVVTTYGALSEPLWQDGAVALVPADRPQDMAARARTLLDDPPARLALGQRASALYREQFSLDRVIRILLGKDASTRI